MAHKINPLDLIQVGTGSSAVTNY